MSNKTIRLEIELTYDADLMYGDDADGLTWFYDEVLLDLDNEGLILHSNMVGEEIGTVKIISIQGTK